MRIMPGGTYYEYEVDQSGTPAPVSRHVWRRGSPCGHRVQRGQEEASTPPENSVFVEKVGGDDQVGETGRPLPDRIVVRVLDAEGLGVEGVTVAFAVTGGGGALSASSAVTDPDGEASVIWTLGVPPVWNRVRASAGGDEAEFTAWADPGERPEMNVLLEGGGLDFANEDLAFAEGRGLFLGSPGAILNIPAPGESPVEIDLLGEAIESPAGIAFGTTGDLYVCENDDPTHRSNVFDPQASGRFSPEDSEEGPLTCPTISQCTARARSIWPQRAIT